MHTFSWDIFLNNALSVIAVLACFGFMIFVHEFGHFIMAKRNGVRVHDFSLGFGPPIFKKRKGETDYCIRAVPLGGYVKLEGEDEPASSPEDSGNFQNKTVWQRMKILVGGCAMNYIAAVLTFLFVGLVWGVGEIYVPPKIASVQPNTPAQKVGLLAGDEITGINGEPITNSAAMILYIQGHPNQTLDLTIKRGNEVLNMKATTFLDKENNIGRLGFIPSQNLDFMFTKKPFLATVGESIYQTYFFSYYLPYKAVMLLVEKRIPAKKLVEGMAGPVGIGQIIFEIVQKGVAPFLFFSAVLNACIGFFNLIPLPALDGGRVFFLFVELLMRKRLDPEKEGMVHYVGFMVLILVALLITFNDFIRIFKGQSFFK